MSPSQLTQQTRIIDRCSRDIRKMLETRLRNGTPLATVQLDTIARRLKTIHEVTLAMQSDCQDEFIERTKRK